MVHLTSVQKKRRQFNRYSWTSALLLAGSLLLLNLIFRYFPIRWDTSEGGVYSISTGTKKLLKELDDTLLIRLFFSSKLPPNFKLNEQYIRDLLSEYKRASHGKIRMEYLDPNKSSKTRQQAIQSGVYPVKMDVREKDRREVAERFMGLSMLYGDQSEVIPFIQDTMGLEYDISQRIKRLVRPGEVRVGIIKNAEALTFESDALKELKTPMSELFTLTDVDLKEEIPADLKGLWLVGPTAKLEKEHVEKLKGWVEAGGTLGLLLDRHSVQLEQFRAQNQETGLEDLLKTWGIDFKPGLVVDRRCDRIQIQTRSGYIQWINYVEYPYFPLVVDLNREHPATKGIDMISMPFVSPLFIDENKKKAGLTYTSIAKSSQYSWLDPYPGDISPLEKYAPSERSKKGPFDLALLVEGKFGETKAADSPIGRLIVFGTSRFVRTDFPPKTQNFSVFMNFMDWSVQDDLLLSIRSKGVAMRPIKEMPESVRLLVKYGLIIALPLFVLFLGLFVWRRAKLRRALYPVQYKEA